MIEMNDVTFSMSAIVLGFALNFALSLYYDYLEKKSDGRAEWKEEE